MHQRRPEEGRARGQGRHAGDHLQVKIHLGCDVRGTIEVLSERPLGTALRVAVWIADAPALSDTVTLFMGSPRSFDLGRFPCGGHRLELRPLGPRRFVVATPPPSVFPCVEGMQPFRVILRPR